MKNIMSFIVALFVAAASGGCDQESYSSSCPEPDVALRSGAFPSQPQVVASFTQGVDHPEGVAVDKSNNVYITMALSGEIRKIASNGTQSTLAQIDLGPPEACPGELPGIMGAITIDFFGNLYVGTGACQVENSGLWRIAPNGQKTRIATLPLGAYPNGIAYRAGFVYVSDSFSPRLFRAPAHGKSTVAADVWLESPLLDVVPQPILTPGANGVQFYLDELYVANSSQQTIVVVPLQISGAHGYLAPGAGQPYVKFGPAASNPEHVYTGDNMPGCDDFAFNVLGEIYCTTDPFQTVVHISRQGHVTELLAAADGLDGPTAAAFGRKGKNRTLYITNASFPFFESTGNGPSLMSIQTLLPGYPLR